MTREEIRDLRLSAEELIEKFELSFDHELIRIVLAGRNTFPIQGGKKLMQEDMTLAEFLELLPSPLKFLETYVPYYLAKHESAHLEQEATHV